MKKENVNSKIKNIVEGGLIQGWSYNNIVSQICFQIPNSEELEYMKMFPIFDFSKETISKAEQLYNQYRKEYYASNMK